MQKILLFANNFLLFDHFFIHSQFFIAFQMKFSSLVLSVCVCENCIKFQVSFFNQQKQVVLGGEKKLHVQYLFTSVCSITAIAHRERQLSVVKTIVVS